MAAKRHGAVVVFKEGVTKQQAQGALVDLSGVLDTETIRALLSGRCVETFDPDEGGPVWYIP